MWNENPAWLEPLQTIKGPKPQSTCSYRTPVVNSTPGVQRGKRQRQKPLSQPDPPKYSIRVAAQTSNITTGYKLTDKI